MIEARPKYENLEVMSRDEHEKETLSTHTSVQSKTDLDFFLDMVRGSSYGTIIDIREDEGTYIDYEDEHIPTKEVVLEVIEGVGEFVAIFCASDGSFITNMFYEANHEEEQCEEE